MILGPDTETLPASVWFSVTSATSSGILNLRMAPFSTCCCAIVVFPRIYQTDVILSASIANGIEPDVTSLPCEAGSTGKGMRPVGVGLRMGVRVFLFSSRKPCALLPMH